MLEDYVSHSCVTSWANFPIPIVYFYTTVTRKLTLPFLIVLRANFSHIKYICLEKNKFIGCKEDCVFSLDLYYLSTHALNLELVEKPRLIIYAS